MAQEMINEVVKTVVQYAFKQIALQLGYLWHYKRNINTLSEEALKLENEQAGLQGRVEAEVRNNRVVLPTLEEWMKKADQVRNETQQFFRNEIKENQTCFKLLMCPDLISRHRVSRRATKKNINIGVLIEEGKSFTEFTSPAPPPSAADRFGDDQDFESRTRIIDEIVKALEDDQIKIVGVFGMGGVGKTTLIKEVAKKVEERKSFIETALATVSQVRNVSDIQHSIAEQLGLELKKENESSQAGKLSQRLSNSKGRVLLILDDLWDTLDLNKIGIHPSKSCKVILTSRDKSVCRKMNCDEEFEIEILSQAEGLSLFQKTIRLIIDSRDLLPMAEEIVAKCQGLPLAIKAIAMALKGKSRNSWKLAILDVQKSPEKIEGMTKEVYSVLSRSFMFLNPEEQLCFLICRFFEEDTNIPIEVVMSYGTGLRMLGDVDSIEEARTRTSVLVENLKARCLLLGGEHDDSIRMHDVFRDFARYMAFTGEHGYKFLIKEGKSANVWPNVPDLINYTAISLLKSGIGELPERVDCPKLEVLKIERESRSQVQFPTDFFVNMMELKVLDIKYMSITLLPSSIMFITKLQTMHLDHCGLVGNIHFIAKLKDLKILRIRACNVKELPKEFGELAQLVILDLTDCSELSVVPPNLLSRLTQLECLYMKECLVRWGEGNNASLDELKHLCRLKTLEIRIEELSMCPIDHDLEKLKLKKFHVSIGGRNFYGRLEKKEGRVLYMNDVSLQKGFVLPAWVRSLVRRAKLLSLKSCGEVFNCVLDTLKRHGFAKLRYLEVEEFGVWNGNEEDIDLGLSECNELLELHIGISRLTNLWKESTSYAFLEKLKHVKVHGSSRLKSLFPWHVSNHLGQLQHLTVQRCESTEEVFVEDGDEIVFPNLKVLELDDSRSLRSFCADRKSTSISSPCFFDGKVKLPALEELKISQLPMIEELCSDQLGSESFCELKSLEVDDCTRLVKLFPSSILPRLKNLKKLAIRGCESLEVAEIERLIGVDGYPVDLLTTFELLELHVVRLSQLTKMWWNKDGNETCSFRYRVGTLRVGFCNRLSNLFVPCAVNKNFNHLKELHIFDCENLVEVVAAATTEEGGSNSVEFSCVTNLQLWNLPKLRRFCSGWDHTLMWPSLTHVTLLDCPNMQAFCSGTLVTPVLEYVSIDDETTRETDLNRAIRSVFERNRKQKRFHGRVCELKPQKPKTRTKEFGLFRHSSFR